MIVLLISKDGKSELSHTQRVADMHAHNYSLGSKQAHGPLFEQDASLALKALHRCRLTPSGMRAASY